MPSTTTVESLQALNNSNVLKLHVGAAIFGDADAPLISSLFASDGTLNALPSGYYSAGLTDTSGITTSRAITVNEVMSWQSVEPQRSDVESDKLQVKVKFQETLNPVVTAVQEGKRLDTVLAAVNGATNYSFDKDPSGVQPKRRLLLLGHDTTRDVIVARYLPNVSLTALGDQLWQRATEIQNDVTFDAYVDAAFGTASRYFVGGAGLASILSGESATIPAWQATTAYSVGSEVLISGKVLQATVAGTSGSTAPVPPTTVGGTVTDGTVTWKRTA